MPRAGAGPGGTTRAKGRREAFQPRQLPERLHLGVRAQDLVQAVGGHPGLHRRRLLQALWRGAAGAGRLRRGVLRGFAEPFGLVFEHLLSEAPER
jgi:hypothetical protein